MDKILIEQTKEGKREAFGKMIERYAKDIYNLNFRLCGGNREEAEDLTQQVFIN